MKALQATCILGAITFTGMIYQVGGNTPFATVPHSWLGISSTMLALVDEVIE